MELIVQSVMVLPDSALDELYDFNDYDGHERQSDRDSEFIESEVVGKAEYASDGGDENDHAGEDEGD